jgi:hypothetical protein
LDARRGANFLGRVLGPAAVVLAKEIDDAARNDKIRIFGPAWFDASSEDFDVAINADSLIEMDRRRAGAYSRSWQAGPKPRCRFTAAQSVP